MTKPTAREIADALAPRYADHLLDLVALGRDQYQRQFGRVPDVVEAVLREWELVEHTGGPVTLFGQDVARELKAARAGALAHTRGSST